MKGKGIDLKTKILSLVAIPRTIIQRVCFKLLDKK